jgi:transcriptional regulator with XRE-family HTH domain
MNGGRNAPRDRGAKSPITAARLAAGMTQGQLAEAVGCMQKDISRWERGVYSPRVDVLAKMAEALGCSIDELISKGQD